MSLRVSLVECFLFRVRHNCISFNLARRKGCPDSRRGSYTAMSGVKCYCLFPTLFMYTAATTPWILFFRKLDKVVSWSAARLASLRKFRGSCWSRQNERKSMRILGGSLAMRPQEVPFLVEKYWSFFPCAPPGCWSKSYVTLYFQLRNGKNNPKKRLEW